MLFRFLVLALLFFQAFVCLSQEYRSRVYTEEDGLANTVVFSVATDQMGRIWCGTRSGISVFDGVSWQRKTPDPLKFFSMVQHLECDERGVIWAAQNVSASRVAYFEKGQWHFLPSQGEGQYPFGGRMEMAVAYWDGQPAVLLSFTNGFSLWYGESWRHISFPNGQQSVSNVSLATQGESFFVASELGLMKLEKNAEHLTPVPGVPQRFQQLRNIVHDPSASGKDSFWLTGWRGEEDTEWIGNYSNGRFTLVHEFGSLGKVNVLYSRLNLLPDRVGGLFVGFSERLFYWDPLEQRLISLLRKNALTDGMLDGVVDREGNIWIATNRGLQKIINPFIRSYTEEDGLFENETASLLDLGNDRLLIGHNRGLTLKADSSFSTYQLPGSRTMNTRIVDMDQDLKGNVWFSTLDLGVGQLVLGEKDDLNQARVTYFPARGQVGDRVFSVLVDQDDQVWALTYRSLHQFSDGRFQRKEDGLFGDLNLRRLMKDGVGNIYVSSRKAGLFAKSENTWFHIQSSQAAYNDVFSIARDRQGTLWVGTLAGLARTNDRELIAEAHHPALKRPVYSLSVDEDNVLWVGTDQGIVRYERGDVRHFSRQLGIAGQETNRAANLVDGAGNIWIGTNLGLSQFRRAHYPGPPTKPLISISGAFADGKPLDWREPIRLKHNQNNLTVDIMPISLIHEEKNQMAYILEPFDDEWIFEPARGDIRYPHLPPGTYRFRVKMANVYGDWSEERIIDQIFISNPFFRSLWFLLVVSGLLVGLGFLLFGFFNARLTSRKLERQVAQRTKELAEKNVQLERKILDHEAAKAEIQAMNNTLEERVSERTRELKTVQKNLVESAHYAGMAEIATSILHNVGNVLNSVSTSGHLIRETLDQSKTPSLIMANQLLEEHRDNLAAFLSEDDRGKRLASYYASLGNALLKEQDTLAKNIALLLEKVDTIKSVVAQQHNYASGIYQSEKIDPVELFGIALSIVEDSMGYGGVALHKEFGRVPEIPVQKTKLVHCLINLIKNAIESVEEAHPPSPAVQLRVCLEGKVVRMEVADNGVGIPEEMMDRVFTHGFTTKKKGHGFGLHSCANAIGDMGGTISVSSGGPGKGAVFVIKLPISHDDK